MNKLSTIRDFINKYNTLDYFLRELVNGDENKGYISIYKDTLDDVMEQMQFKSLNQLRNQIAHGVFLSNEPIMLDSSLVQFIEKHLDYVTKNSAKVKENMLVAIDKRKEKDLVRGITDNISHIKENGTNVQMPLIENPKNNNSNKLIYMKSYQKLFSL